MSCQECVFQNNCSVIDKANCTMYDDGADHYDRLRAKEDDHREQQKDINEDRWLSQRGGYGL